MSRGGEPKRVSLTSIIQSDAVFSRFGTNFLEPEPLPGSLSGGQKASKTTKSIRIKLELFETDSNKYPEFNFSRLLYLEKKKAKKLKQVAQPCNGAASDPFADNDDDVARVVKELEAKYGNSYATGRGKSKKDDHRDIGMGYDESDSFIDNTDAYDEMIPEEAETLEGGFYINCGALEFKNLTKKSYTTRTDAIIKMPERSRKRIVSSSSDSSSSSSGEDGENDDDNNGAEEESDSDDDDDEDDESDSEEDDSDSESLEDEDSATTAKSSSKYKDNQAKRAKVIVTGKSKSSSSSNASGKKPPKKPVVTSSSSNSPRPITVEISDTDERQVLPQPQQQPQTQAQAQAQALKKVVKTTTVKDMLKAKRDSFLKSQSGTAAVKGAVNGELKCNSTDRDSSSDSSDMESATEQGRADKQEAKRSKEAQENLRTADTVLPAKLEGEILSAMNNFKEAVRSRDMCGKKFSLDAKLTPLLLKVYEAVQSTDRNSRNMVFSHIEYQLQLPKYYILRKGKAVRAKQEKNKTTNALEKLRRAVSVVMPKAIANYEMELRNFAEQAAADVNCELPPKMPRKKFQWTSELRQLLYDVYQARWTSYAVLATRKDSLEEFINWYLRDKLVDIWPLGWMRYDELQREISRHKNANRKPKDKPKVSLAPKPTASNPAAPIPAATADQVPHLKPLEEPRSRGNSDTDSATSASSNSLKRKLKDLAMHSTKPPKKKVAKPPPNMLIQQQQLPQFQLTPAATAAVSAPAILNSSSNNHNPRPSLDSLLSMPSTSAQAAALVAANTVMDLATSSRRSDPLGGSSIFNLITAATFAASGNPGQLPIDGQAKVCGVRPMPHVINLDDYHCPSEILRDTSKQLAVTSSVITSTSAVNLKASQSKESSGSKVPQIKESSSSKIAQIRESSSESDGVEIVGVYPAAKPKQSSATPKAKNKNLNRANSRVSNGSLGFNAKNMYIYNNNNSGALGPVYDLTTGTQMLKAMSNLKALERITWSPPSGVKGAAAGLTSPSTGAGTSSHQ
ncbi:hypothetical protein KR009_003597 [Drosophila setifemur]|nr:hypothetical protein KR009_003597 [Drosophila setifemur]